jgi:hypothetical protein
MIIKEVQVLGKGTTKLFAQFETDKIDSWEWKKGPSIRRLKYEVKLGIHEWVGSSEDRPKWWN